jgi:hypothetical protein
LTLVAAPGTLELRSQVNATVAWIVDTNTLARVADVPVGPHTAAAFELPDRRAVVTSQVELGTPKGSALRLVEAPSGHTLDQWPGSVYVIEVRPNETIGRSPRTHSDCGTNPACAPRLRQHSTSYFRSRSSSERTTGAASLHESCPPHSPRARSAGAAFATASAEFHVCTWKRLCQPVGKSAFPDGRIWPEKASRNR